MKTPIRTRYTLLASVLLMVGGCTLACFLWVKAEQRQYAMNRALIEAIVLLDFKRAKKSVESGANPDTPINPPPIPTWLELVHHLFHPAPPRKITCPTAFMAVCWTNWIGEYEDVDRINIPESRRIPVTHDKDGTMEKVRIPARLFRDPETTKLALLMIAHGANVNATDGSGWTALMMVSAFGITDRMSLLLQHGADVDYQARDGSAALNLAIEHHKPESPEAVALLLKYHANPNLRDHEGHTPLSYALEPETNSETDRHQYKQIIRLLKAAGATK